MNNGFEAAWSVALDVEGWLTEAQARALYRAACQVEAGCSIVEIGSHRGRSTILLARAANAGVDVVAVDPFGDVRWGGGADTYTDFLANLSRAGVEDSVRVIRAVSDEAVRAWDGAKIGLVYVDGAHDRASVLADIDGWLPRLEEGGFFAVHDAFSSVGVTLALLQRFAGRRGFAYEEAVGSLLLLRKAAGRSPSATFHLVARLPYFVRNVLVKIALRRGWSNALKWLRHYGDSAPY